MQILSLYFVYYTKLISLFFNSLFESSYISKYTILVRKTDLDGFEVATRIRKFRSGNQPMIVALTASAEEDLWERCMQVGINGVIRKPVLLHGIASELRRILMQGNNVL